VVGHLCPHAMQTSCVRKCGRMVLAICSYSGSSRGAAGLICAASTDVCSQQQTRRDGHRGDLLVAVLQQQHNHEVHASHSAHTLFNQLLMNCSGLGPSILWKKSTVFRILGTLELMRLKWLAIHLRSKQRAMINTCWHVVS